MKTIMNNVRSCYRFVNLHLPQRTWKQFLPKISQDPSGRWYDLKKGGWQVDFHHSGLIRKLATFMTGMPCLYVFGKRRSGGATAAEDSSLFSSWYSVFYPAIMIIVSGNAWIILSGMCNIILWWSWTIHWQNESVGDLHKESSTGEDHREVINSWHKRTLL